MAACYRSTKDRKLQTHKLDVQKVPLLSVKIYVDQMDCHISTRILEYIRDIRLENQKITSIQTFHRCLNICTYIPTIMEAIKITKHPSNFICKDGYR
jgi:hypothetical protein